MVQQNCEPENIFGPPQQTMFLGCSIQGFSASAGWNEQASELTVEVVKDSCTSPKRYWNADLEDSIWNAPDPGFVGLSINIVGAPVLFRFGDFEFSGLVQGWEEINGESGYPTYRVKIVDPRLILEKSQIIINEYSGSVGTLHNVINAYGYMESFGSSCAAYYQSTPGTYVPGNGNPDGTIFGSPAGAYGGADTNANGTQWNQILAATRALLCAVTPLGNDFSPYGRLAFKAPASIGNGFGLMAADSSGLAYYFLDLDEVPTAPSYWRFDGISMGVLEAVSQICDDAGYDYYVELIPVIYNDAILKFIKVRTVSRNAAPVNNSIDTFIANAGREVVTFNRGRELRNEKNSAIVIGGPKQTYYQAFQNTDPEGNGQPANPEADDMIVPYFGIDPDTGNVYLPEKDGDGYWEVTVKAYDLALQLLESRYGKAIPTTLTISEKEMICAESGFDVWAAYSSMNNTPLYAALDISTKSIIDLSHFANIFDDEDFDPDIDDIRPADLLAIRQGVFPLHTGNTEMEIMQIAYAWIQKLTDEYYGKKFQVRVPFTCIRQDSESAQIIPSEEPSDGGWTEHTTVLGLAHPSVQTDFFTLDDNRLGSFCRFGNTNGVECVNISEEDFIADESLWVRSSVESYYVYANATTFLSPRAIICLPQCIKVIPTAAASQAQWGALTQLLNDFDADIAPPAIIQNVQRVAGNMLTHWALQTRSLMPNAVGFGVKSNVLTYGPWAAAGAVGQVEVIREEGLVPWEYGGYTTMNLAGNATASAGVTNQQVTEQGSITVAGMPELPLGAELLAADVGGPFNGGGNNLIENRSLNTGTSTGETYGYLDPYLWSGAFGPNVTDISVSANGSGFTTTYNIRVWSPKFGRFAKYNAERIKTIGKRRLEYQKAMRAYIRNRAVGAKVGKAYRTAALRDRRMRQAKALNKGAHAAPKTPHEAFVGQYINWNQGDFRRPVVTSSPSTELPVEFDGYENKAIMSLDGLLRPVSIAGSGGLPRFAQIVAGCQNTASAGSQPPTDKPTQAGSFLQYKGAVTNQYLNPLTNPEEGAAADKSDTTDIGHDIEMVAYGEEPPPSSLISPIQGYADEGDFSKSHYAEDYRFMALRGPIVLAGWGHDLDSFPVPNKADNEADCKDGVFTDENLENKFLDDWLRKPDTWPVGPLDVRWDRARGVWTIPQFRNVEGFVKETGAPGTYIVQQTSGPTLYDSAGASFSAEFIVEAPDTDPLASGDIVLAGYDPQECKYRILERPRRSKVRLYDVCCTGNLSQAWGDEDSGYGIDTNEIIMGAGLIMATGAGTDPYLPRVQINVKKSYSNLPCCTVPADGYDRITVASGIEHINFGAGLFAVRGNMEGQDGEAGTLCEFQEATCDDNSCYLNLMAGFQVANNYNADPDWSNGEELTIDGSKIFNFIDLQGGLRAIDGEESCSMAIKAGIEVTKYTGCLVGLVHTQPNTINHKFNLGPGFQVYDEDQNDGIVNLDAGFRIDSDDSCVNPEGTTQTPMINQYFNKIVFHRGTNYQRDEDDPCSLHLGAGVDFVYETGCVPAPGSMERIALINTINVKEGLSFTKEDQENPQCDAQLGVNMKMGNQRGAGFLVGDDFEVLSPTDTGNPGGGGCYAKIDLEDKFQEDYEVTVITDVSTECCPSGGFSSITYETKTLTFNKKGLLISVEAGQEIVETCPCSGSGTGSGDEPATGTGCECPEGYEQTGEEPGPDATIILTCDDGEGNILELTCGSGSGDENEPGPCCLGTGDDAYCVHMTPDNCAEAEGIWLGDTYASCELARNADACGNPDDSTQPSCMSCCNTYSLFMPSLTNDPDQDPPPDPPCRCEEVGGEYIMTYGGTYTSAGGTVQNCTYSSNRTLTTESCPPGIAQLTISYNTISGLWSFYLSFGTADAEYSITGVEWDCTTNMNIPVLNVIEDLWCEGWPSSVLITPNCSEGFAIMNKPLAPGDYIVPSNLKDMFIDGDIRLA